MLDGFSGGMGIAEISGNNCVERLVNRWGAWGSENLYWLIRYGTGHNVKITAPKPSPRLIKRRQNGGSSAAWAK